MENELVENFQDVAIENEADQAMEDCLRNPVIVRKILGHISSKALLQISLVNKLWKYEARSLVSQRRSFIANLKSRSSPVDRCEAVVAFVSDLPKLSPAPFSGIQFDNFYHHGHHVCSFTPEDLVRINDVNLLDQLSVKNVSVKMTGRWQEFGTCPAFLLTKKVLQQFCEDLEELELKISDEHDDYVDKVVKACCFPRLKILKVTCDALTLLTSQTCNIENYMRALLARAPNLKMLHTNWKMNSVLHLLQGTSVEFVYTTPIHCPFDEISDNAISSGTRFEAMNFGYIDHRFNLERINRIAPILLQESRTTVRLMSMDAVFAGPLMCYGTRLENVKHLWIHIGRLYSIEPLLNTIMDFDFTRIFPNVDKVCVVAKSDYWYRLSPQQVNALIVQANAVLTEPLPDRAARIRKLSLPGWHPCRVSAQIFFVMFPNIEKLEITTGPHGPIPFVYIWNWTDLIEIEIEGSFVPTTENLDSEFCGIFPEEAAELRLKDDEYLKQVNIVPVMPAITCLRNLRTINLHYGHYYPRPIVDSTFIFSKVTALLAFARQPGLVVNLRLSRLTAPPAMTHLEPYVSVTCDLH